jgi:hypothetical protein
MLDIQVEIVEDAKDAVKEEENKPVRVQQVRSSNFIKTIQKMRDLLSSSGCWSTDYYPTTKDCQA